MVDVDELDEADAWVLGEEEIDEDEGTGRASRKTQFLIISLGFETQIQQKRLTVDQQPQLHPHSQTPSPRQQPPSPPPSS